MGLLSRVFTRNTSDVSPRKPAGVKTDAAVKTKPELTNKEEKIVADKIEVGYVHMSGCTG